MAVQINVTGETTEIRWTSKTDLMIQVFSDLRANRPKTVESSDLNSLQVRGWYKSIPNNGSSAKFRRRCSRNGIYLSHIHEIDVHQSSIVAEMTPVIAEVSEIEISSSISSSLQPVRPVEVSMVCSVKFDAQRDNTV